MLKRLILDEVAITEGILKMG